MSSGESGCRWVSGYHSHCKEKGEGREHLVCSRAMVCQWGWVLEQDGVGRSTKAMKFWEFQVWMLIEGAGAMDKWDCQSNGKLGLPKQWIVNIAIANNVFLIAKAMDCQDCKINRMLVLPKQLIIRSAG